MTDRLSYARSRVEGKLAEFAEGTVTLTRSADSTPNAPEPGTVTTSTYTLDAVVSGASQYADGTLVLATDVVLVMSPVARDAGGNPVSIVPILTDLVTFGGIARRPKRVEAVPASGDPVKFRVFLGS